MHSAGGTSNRDWWPNQLDVSVLRRNSAEERPAGRRLRLRRGVRGPRPRRRQARHRRGHDRLAGLVARRLRPLRPALHPHGLAQRRHLPHQRRPRRRRHRPAALRPAQQLARQRQPRQGPPPAVAGQEEVRPARSRGPTCMVLAGNVALEYDGLRDLRLRRRPRRRLGAGAGQLGRRGRVARRRPLQRRPRARRTRSAPSRWASSTSTPRAPTATPTRCSRPRDIRETFAPHGDERRGDRRAHRRRPHLRQDPRRRRPERVRRPRARGRAAEQQGLGWKNSLGTGKGGDAITSGLEGTWTPTPTTWDNSFFETLFKLRVGAHEEPRRRAPVGPDRPGRGHDRRPTRTTRRRRTRRSMLTTDLALRFDPVYEPISRRFLREPGRVRRRVRPRLVQADAPRHGPDRALPRPRGPGRGAHLAGPGPGRRPATLVGAADVAALKAADRSPRACRSSQLVSTAWASASTFRGTDKRGGANGARIRLAPQNGWDVNDPAELATVLRTLEGIQAEFNAARRRAGLARRPDRARAATPASSRRRRRPASTSTVPFTPGSHRRDAGADRRRVVRRPRADGRRVPQLPRQGPTTRRPSTCSSTRRTCSPSPRRR